MAVAIRLRREGKKKFPYYRIVATDSRFKRDGRFLELLGTYQPCAPGDTQTTIKEERIKYWISVGANPSDTVWSIIKKYGFKKPVASAKRKKKAA
ncbi:MAG: 30S ribosomal protein S16 [Candidatus Aureabacteria bacterium]|nr:30S ribosomal protein S16 [Candidatus Auribacterota bacterium]